jgi:nucleotide-binding universal stress UspA family protein
MKKTPTPRAAAGRRTTKPAPAILVPMDSSRNALRALDHGIALARLTGSTLHVLHVEPAFDDYGMVGAYMTPSVHRKTTSQRAREILAPAVTRLERAHLAHEVHVAWGKPAKEIARAARRLRCAGIVMGTRGMGATGNLLLGSTATQVVHLAKVPVTLIK